MKVVGPLDILDGSTAKRLFGPIAGTGSAATLLTATASRTTIIRVLHICNTTSGALTFRMSIGADAAGTRLFSDQSVPANGVLRIDGGFDVLAAGETLQWNAPTGLTASCFGVEVV